MQTEINGWVKQKEWYGNPALGLDSWMKKFSKGGRSITVFLFGKEGEGKNRPCRNEKGEVTHYRDFSDWTYTIKGEYTGGFYPETPTLEEAMAIVDDRARSGELFK